MPSVENIRSSSPARNSRQIPAPLLALGIFAITLLAYLPAINGTPLWDDAAHLTAPALQSGSGLRMIWFQLGATQQYYPVLHSAFWLEHKIWGDAVLGYHLLNIALHATAACLLALLLTGLQTAPATGPSNRPRSSWAGWLAAAVFALHPVCVESVAWISEQKNTLSLVFYLLAALAYLRFDCDRTVRWYVLASGLFVLALLTKSVTATLPAALLLLAYGQRGKLSWRRDLLPLLPWFIVGAATGLFTAWVERHYIGGKAAHYDLNLLQRTLLAGNAAWFYLGKLVWPTQLMFIYPRWDVAATFPWSMGSLALGATLAVLWRLRVWSRGPLVAALFFVGSLFPALGFIYVYPFIFSYVADHWQYLPCLGIIALGTESVVYFARQAEQRSSVARHRIVRAGFALGTALLLGTLFTLTWRQSRAYQNVATLYTDTLEKNPACWMAHNNLGLHLIESGAPPEGIAHLEKALQLNPAYADAYNNLGNALAKIPARMTEAISALETALRLDPAMVEAHHNLGALLIQYPPRVAEGIAHLRQALALRPDLPHTHFLLGTALLEQPGQLTEAGIALERAVRLDPNNADAQNNLGGVLLQLGRAPAAIIHFQAALQLTPESAEAHFNLGRAHRFCGDWTAAIAEYQKAIVLTPLRAEIWNSLGSAYYQLERNNEAVAAYTEAVRLQPDVPSYHYNLGLALQQTGRAHEAAVEFKTAGQSPP
jgi:tetratricopeptide (TPR) repeat protein